VVGTKVDGGLLKEDIKQREWQFLFSVVQNSAEQKASIVNTCSGRPCESWGQQSSRSKLGRANFRTDEVDCATKKASRLCQERK
jgi:hypothetical protein